MIDPGNHEDESLKSNTTSKRKALVVHSAAGRPYEMGRMRAVFKADSEETDARYSISEWWLEPNTAGPGSHEHEDDHIFYVIEGTVSLLIDGEWNHAEKGSYAVLPGGTSHDFENRGSTRCGFMSLNVPGGFESAMPHIVKAMNENPLGDASVKA